MLANELAVVCPLAPRSTTTSQTSRVSRGFLP